ncbi:hypothetical protein JNUCC74_02400 [Cerasibacillus sp. JNUCC 74]
MIRRMRQSLEWSSKIRLLTFGMVFLFSFVSTLFQEGAGSVYRLRLYNDWYYR